MKKLVPIGVACAVLVLIIAAAVPAESTGTTAPATTSTATSTTTTVPVASTTPSTVATTSTVPVAAPPSTTGTYAANCETATAWVSFTNTGGTDDRLSVGGFIVVVPAAETVRFNLFRLDAQRHALGPVVSLSTARTVGVANLGRVNGLGDVFLPCETPTTCTV